MIVKMTKCMNCGCCIVSTSAITMQNPYSTRNLTVKSKIMIDKMIDECNLFTKIILHTLLTLYVYLV